MALTTELRSFSFRRLSEVLENTEEFATVAGEIVAEFKTVGFLRLEDIPGFIDQELLDEIKWFHSLPFDTKMKISLKRFGAGMGMGQSHESHGFLVPGLESRDSNLPGLSHGFQSQSRLSRQFWCFPS